MKNEQRLKWSQRLMSLSHSDIHWCLFSQKDFTFIECFGEFSNVPLLGIRGGITYNPSLALRQFGYARRDGPHDMLLQDIVFDYNHDLHNYRRRFMHAWGHGKEDWYQDFGTQKFHSFGTLPQMGASSSSKPRDAVDNYSTSDNGTCCYRWRTLYLSPSRLAY